MTKAPTRTPQSKLKIGTEKRKAVKTLVPDEKTSPTIVQPSINVFGNDDYKGTVEPRRKRRKRGTSTEKMYFTEDTEKHIVLYNECLDVKEQQYLYEEHIKYPFEKLAENVLNTFKFSYFEVGPLDVQKEVVSFLVSNIGKYKAGKGKAFSYFSIIAKHYLILLNNTVYKRWKTHVDITDQPHDRKELVILPAHAVKSSELKEFIGMMIEYWENNIPSMFKKQKDLEIANAVIELFRSSERIENFNKKALYLYVREMTDCKTQHITKVINKMKSAQSYIAKKYKNEGYLDVNESINNSAMSF